MMEKQRTGEATLLIHMLRIRATNMLVMSTVRGRVPALLRTSVARYLAIWNLDNAAAMVKPPSRSMMTGVHIDAKTYFAASRGANLVCGFSSSRTTWRTTARNGTNIPVTKRGMTFFLSGLDMLPGIFDSPL